MVEGPTYTEYGYRGTEELIQAQKKIAELQQEIEALKEELRKCNENTFNY